MQEVLNALNLVLNSTCLIFNHNLSHAHPMAGEGIFF